MAELVLLPRQGNTVESCIILEWKKGEGDSVSEGETLCEVETDKATFEVESTATGVLRKRLVSEGDDVPVLDPIAVIGGAEEDISALIAEASGGAGSAPKSDETTGESEQEESPSPAARGEDEPAPVTDDEADSSLDAPVTGKAGTRAPVSPRARMRAQQEAIDPASLEGSGPGGRVIERDVLAAAEVRGAVTPAAKGLLSQSGESFGAGGRLTAAGAAGQVQDGSRLHSEAGGQSDGEPGRGADLGGYPGATEDRPVKGIRRVIAERTRTSLQETAQLTLHRWADAEALLAYRKRLKGSSQESLSGISINDLIHCAVSRALTEFPEMNAHFLGDKLRLFKEVHLGFAVDTPRGLMVPTILSAQRRSLKELSAEAKRLASLATEAKAGPEELRTETFTVTNLGALGIDYFTPVLNPPAVAILGVGSIEPRPASVADPQRFVPRIALSLTIDHQAVDGAPGARFLQRLAAMIAEIDLVLAG